MDQGRELLIFNLTVDGDVEYATKDTLENLSSYLLTAWERDKDLTAIPCYNILAAFLRCDLLHDYQLMIDNWSEPQIMALLGQKGMMFFWVAGHNSNIVAKHAMSIERFMKAAGPQFTIAHVTSDIGDALRRCCVDAGYKDIEIFTPAFIATLRKEDLMEHKPKEGYLETAIPIERNLTVYEHWHYSRKNKKYLLDSLHKEGFSSCLLNADGFMVAWSIDYGMGRVGSLHTLPEFRNQGLASCVISSMSQKILNRGPYVPHAGFVPGPTTELSMKAFLRCGYQVHNRILYSLNVM